MRTTHLGAAHVRPGVVTAWVPTPGCVRAVRGAPPDARPLTEDQESHLLASAGASYLDPAEAPWIGFSVVLTAPTSTSVAAALASFFDRHESLRCDYVPDGERHRRRLASPGTVEFEPLPVGHYSGVQETHAAVVEHLASHAQPHVWPRAGFVTVESEAGLTLYAAFDHVTFDVQSMYAAADELPLLHHAYSAADAPDPCLARPGSHLDHAQEEADRLREVGPDDPRLAGWRALLEDGPAVPAPPSSGVRSGERWGHELTTMPVATPGEVRELDELSRSWGSSLERIFLALLLSSIAGLEPGPNRLRALVAVPGRPPGQEGAVGWFAKLGPLVLDLEPGLELATLLARTTAVLDQMTEAAQLPLPVVRSLLDRPVEPELVLAVADHRAVPRQGWRTSKAHGFLGHVPAGAQVHAAISCLSSGALLEARHPDTPICSAWMATVAVGVRRGVLAALDPRPATLSSEQATG